MLLDFVLKCLFGVWCVITLGVYTDKRKLMTILHIMMVMLMPDACQHHEKNGLLLWKRCVNDENLLEDARDLLRE